MRLANPRAYALGKRSERGWFHMRRIVWGRAMARMEQRDDEDILPVKISPNEAAP